MSVLRKKIRESENRLSVIGTAFKNLYDDKCAGKIPETVFLSLMSEYSSEQATLTANLPNLQRELESIQETSGGIDDWLALVSSYAHLENLDRATVVGLIESITVSERTKKFGRQRQEIKIEYRFIGNLLDTTKEDIA